MRQTLQALRRVQLTESMRFKDNSGIGQLAIAICAGDAEQTIHLLKANQQDVCYQPIDQPELMLEQLFQGYLNDSNGSVETSHLSFVSTLQQQQNITAILLAFDRFRLCRT